MVRRVKKNTFFWRTLLVFIVLVAVVFSCTGATAAPNSGEDQILSEVKDYLRLFYVDPLTVEQLSSDNLESLILGLKDPYTAYLGPQDYQEFLGFLQGNLSGVGLRLVMDGDHVVVTSTIPGSPGERSGILAGEKILAVDGHPVAGKSLEQVTFLIRGQPGTTVTLTVLGKQNLSRQIRITRETVQVPSCECKIIPGGIAYIRLYDFNTDTAREVREALNQVAPNSKAVMLDLCGNPGGLLDAAVDVASLFIDSGPIVKLTERDGITKTLNAKGDTAVGLPLVVLVDRWSASASEIVAGAIKDRGVGLVVGETTYGKGSVQTVLELSNGGALKLTVARYLTPQGKAVDKKGIEPDYWISSHADQQAYATGLLNRDASRLHDVQLSPGLKAVTLEGQTREMVAAPRMLGSKVFVPLEFFSQVMGARAEYDKARQTVFLWYGSNRLSLEVGKSGPMGPIVEGSQVWVPLRLVAENLGGTVSWDNTGDPVVKLRY